MTRAVLPTTLISGGTSSAREFSIAAARNPVLRTAVILEGLPAPDSPLASAESTDDDLRVIRIAPGCPCCMGNLAMRVTLNRVLRQSPDHLFISLSMPAHLSEVRAFLTASPYDQLLALTPDLLL